MTSHDGDRARAARPSEDPQDTGSAREERSGSHTKDKILSSKADGSWRGRGSWRGVGNSKPSATGGHWPLVVLEVIVGNMNLVILNTSFPSFLHKQRRGHSRNWYSGAQACGPGLLQGSSWGKQQGRCGASAAQLPNTRCHCLKFHPKTGRGEHIGLFSPDTFHGAQAASCSSTPKTRVPKPG